MTRSLTGTTGTVWGSSDLETDDITLNPNGTFTIPESAGNWFFSDDFLYLALGDVQPAAITRDLDTVVFANAEANNQGGGIISNNVGDPIEADGTEKCLDDPAAPDAAAFYRWAVVGAPD